MTEAYVTYDISLHGQYVKPGSRIKIKGEWGTFIYVSILCVGELKDAWLICEDAKGNKHRFKPNRLKKVVNKRSFWKNVRC